ncbi:hypothetical protein LY76DRAFT_58962 [Colletotrichum caudatum]|nr:hypothetical protein LY76DRAFT_58962 [Colletotrichum caudatum]
MVIRSSGARDSAARGPWLGTLSLPTTPCLAEPPMAWYGMAWHGMAMDGQAFCFPQTASGGLKAGNAVKGRRGGCCHMPTQVASTLNKERNNGRAGERDQHAKVVSFD